MRDFFWFFVLAIGLWWGGDYFSTTPRVGIVERPERAVPAATATIATVSSDLVLPPRLDRTFRF